MGFSCGLKAKNTFWRKLSLSYLPLLFNLQDEQDFRILETFLRDQETRIACRPESTRNPIGKLYGFLAVKNAARNDKMPVVLLSTF